MAWASLPALFLLAAVPACINSSGASYYADEAWDEAWDTSYDTDDDYYDEAWELEAGVSEDDYVDDALDEELYDDGMDVEPLIEKESGDRGTYVEEPICDFSESLLNDPDIEEVCVMDDATAANA